MQGYEVFTRNWWKENKSWPDGLEPDGGARKHHIGYFDTEDEARTFCQESNKRRPSSWLRLSRKYEYEKA